MIIIIVIIVIIIISSEITKALKLGSSVPHSYPPEFKASFYTLLARLRHKHLITKFFKELNSTIEDLSNNIHIVDIFTFLF